MVLKMENLELMELLSIKYSNQLNKEEFNIINELIKNRFTDLMANEIIKVIFGGILYYFLSNKK